MDVRQIRDFVAVVRCSSFAAASRSLRVSQPGLGYQVRQLEEELQVRLLERHARGVSLTPAGERFLDHAESILTEINKAKLAMAALAHDDRQDLRIGIAPALVEALGPVLWENDQKNNMRLRLKEACAGELREELINGSLDLGICVDQGRTPLRTVPIYSEPLYLIGPRSDLRSHQSNISLSELAAFPLVLGNREHTVRHLLEEAATLAGLKLTVDREIDSLNLIRSLVLHSACSTVLPYGSLADEFIKRTLSVRRIVDPEIRQSVNVLYASTVSAPMEKIIAGVIQRIRSRAPVPSDVARLVSTAAA